MHQPSLAVVVPVLNEGSRLPELFSRIQLLRADEVILVDGGSTDRSDQLLLASNLRWMKSKAGRAIQMNLGAECCKSDILLFIHADTVITSSHLSAIREVMNYDPSTLGGWFDVRLSGTHPVFRIIEWFINLRSRVTGISTGDQCQFVRRDIFESMGGFPEQPLMEDIEFSKKMKRIGPMACLRDKVTTSSRRWEKRGIFNTVLLMWKLRFYYWIGVDPDRLVKMYSDVR